MSDWCKELRNDPDHLSWMAKGDKRKKKISEIERKSRCRWEDKFRETIESYNHDVAARALDLDYDTFREWARHLGLKLRHSYRRRRSYRRKRYVKKKPTLNKDTWNNPGLKLHTRKLLCLIYPAAIGREVLNLNGDVIIRALKDFLSMLSEYESFILINRYIDNNMTLQQLGHELRLTRERVRQIEAKAIKRLRHPTKQKIFIERLLVNVICQRKNLSELSLIKSEPG